MQLVLSDKLPKRGSIKIANALSPVSYTHLDVYKRQVIALKKLDNKVKTPVNIFTYTFGIISALILGLGMCLCMKVIGDGSTLWFISVSYTHLLQIQILI